MAVFFFLVGLEIKREVMEGELANRAQLALPAFAAAGGMAAPRGDLLGAQRGDPVSVDGWAIPAATDIAFALGVLSLLGSRVPRGLKVFLLTLAILDDLGDDRDHRSLLHRAPVLAVARRRRGRDPAARGPQRRSRASDSGVPLRRPRALGGGAQVGHPRHARRRRARPVHPAPERRARTVATPPARARPPSRGGLRDPAPLRLRQCGGVVPGLSLGSLLDPVPLGIAAGSSSARRSGCSR